MKRERLHLMEKPHDSISGCKPPGCQAPQSKALSLCSAETWARGGELQMVPETSPQLEVRPWALAATGNPPGAPAAVFGPKGYAFQPGCRGSPEQVRRVSHYQPRTGRGPTGCGQWAWPEDLRPGGQCPVDQYWVAAGGGRGTFRSTAVPHPVRNIIFSCEKNLFTSNSHWTLKRSFSPLGRKAGGIPQGRERCGETHWSARPEGFGLWESARHGATRFPRGTPLSPSPPLQREVARCLRKGVFASVPGAELCRGWVQGENVRQEPEGSRVHLTTPGRATPGPCSWPCLLHCCTISFTDFPLRLCRPAPRSQGGGISQGRTNVCPEPWPGRGKGGSPNREEAALLPPGFCDDLGGQELKREGQGCLWGLWPLPGGGSAGPGQDACSRSGRNSE